MSRVAAIGEAGFSRVEGWARSTAERSERMSGPSEPYRSVTIEHCERDEVNTPNVIELTITKTAWSAERTGRVRLDRNGRWPDLFRVELIMILHLAGRTEHE